MKTKEQKKLFKDQNVSIYKLTKDLNISKRTIYKYVEGLSKVENMSAKLLILLADYFEMEIRDIYEKMVEYQEEREEC